MKALKEGHLVECADKIMVFIPPAVINIVIEVVRNESEGLHVEHEFPGINESLSFLGCQDVVHFLQIAFYDSLEIFRADLYFVDVLFFFGHW